MKKRSGFSLLCTGLAVVLCLLILATASAETGGKWGKLSWKLDGKGVLTISGTGDMDPFYYGSADAWRSQQNKITKVVIGSGVTGIGDDAFQGCTKLKSITIPDSVTVIGTQAFTECTSLKSITIPDSVKSIQPMAFEDCPAVLYASLGSNAAKALSREWYNFRVPGTKYDLRYEFNDNGKQSGLSVVSADEDIVEAALPQGVTVIVANAFCGCTKLTSITMPKSVNIIENSAFCGCTGLTGITIPDNVTSIGSSAFSGCTSLVEITLPKGLTDIEESTFSGCTGLKSVTIPDNVTRIRYYAFSGCTSLAEITLPKGLTDIEGSTFSGCTGLKSITIPDGVNSIGWSAFDDCPAIRYASLGSAAAKALSIEGWSFRVSGTKYNLKYNDFAAGGKPKALEFVSADADCGEISIPDYVTRIQDSALENCSELTSITMNKTVASVDFSALFDPCKKLEEIRFPSGHQNYCTQDGIVFSKDQKEILYCPRGKTGDYTIPQSITSIPDGIFQGCKALTGIHIPASVTSIGYDAFLGCSGLLVAEIEARSNDISFPTVFLGCTSLKKIVVSKDHHTYSSKDGVVFNKDGTYLVFCPQGKTGSYAIPGKVTHIAESAFSGCAGITEVSFPDGLYSIDGYAFFGCTGLKKIVFPKTLSWIGWGAFQGCSSLSKVDFSAIPLDQEMQISSDAFKGCKSIKSVTMYNNITGIGSDAFEKTTLIKAPKGSYPAQWAYDNYYELQYIDQLYTVTVTVNGNGTASADPASGPEGTVVTLTATPDEGFRFSEWVVTTGGVTIKNNKFKIGSENVEIEAVFEMIYEPEGWIQNGDGSWSYRNSDGSLKVGPARIDGTLYCFDEQGKMITGWGKVGNVWYYANASGVLADNGWANIGGAWYYFRVGGAMAVGWVDDGGARYYMKTNGTMATGWIQDNGKWYYLSPNGSLFSGWLKSGGTWYLMKPEMATGWAKDGGNWYYFKSSGALAANEWIRDTEAEKKLPEGQKRQLWYWLDPNGIAATGWKKVDGRWEYFSGSGEWLYSWTGN